MRSIPASRSPSSDQLVSRVLAAGPLRVEVSASSGPVLSLIESTLGLFNVDWALGPTKTVTLDIRREHASPLGEGRYLVCARMLVDPVPDGLRATTPSGAWMEGRFSDSGERWTMSVPFDEFTEHQGVDVEDMLSLILTTGWRRLGWVPLHGGGVIAPEGQGAEQGAAGRPSVIVCASSGGGKTTFTLALVRRGWLTVGDDKLLLRSIDGQPTIAAIKHMLNVDPAVSAWFPEANEVYRQPTYSTWTDKRRISVAEIWPHAPAELMSPTHLFVIERRPGSGGIAAERMSENDRIAALLRQTVIPRDPALARMIVGTVSDLAQRVEGHVLEVFDDAYTTPQPIDDLLRLL